MRDIAPLARLVEELERLPGVGARTAERLAEHLLFSDRADALRLADAIRDVKERLHPCRECFNITERELCGVCSEVQRDRSRMCVVERPKDLVALEKAGGHRGIYHVLRGKVAPHEGKGPEGLTLAALRRRLDGADPPVQELIIATNPDAEGDATALVVRDHVADLVATVTRLARGIPSGGSIEFANVSILRDALDARRSMD